MNIVMKAARPLPGDRRTMKIMLSSAERLAGVGSWIWDVVNDSVGWSEEAYRLLGIAPESFDGSLEGFLSHVHPDDRSSLREQTDAVLAGQRHFNYHCRVLGADGRERLIHGDGEGQYDSEGNPLRVVGTVMDITRRERERQAVQESEQRLRSLVALSSDWYWQQDEELRFIEFHPKAERHNAVIGLRRWEVPQFTPIHTTWEDHQALLAARQPFRSLEVRQGSGPGARYVSVSGEPFYDADGHFLGYRGTARDITGRKAAEEHLRQVNASLRMAMRLGRSGAWSLDLPQRGLSWWEGGRLIHGLDGGVSKNLDQLLHRVEPTHRAVLQSAFGRCMSEGEPFDVEVPLVAGMHPRMWVRLIGEALRDAEEAIWRVQGTVQDVTERRLAAERARELGSRLAATLDSTSDAFLTLNREGGFSYLNQQAERLLLRRRADLVGRTLSQEFPGLAGTRFERELRRALVDGETVELEDYFEPLHLWLRIKAFPSPQGLAVYLRDITDSHSVQQALSESQEEQRHLFENTIDGVLYTTPDGRVARANPAACAMLQRQEAELHGQPFTALLRQGGAGLEALCEQRAMTGRASGQLTLVRRDTSEFPVEVSSAEYTAVDGTVRAFVVFRDISQQVRAKQDILQLNAELGERVRRRTSELEAANAELKAFGHSLAHDLQSPLAAIDAYSQLLENALPQPLPERASHYLGRIRAAAVKTSDYAQGLLALARVSQATLTPQRVDLGAIADDVLTQLAERDRDREVTWRVQPGLTVLGDETLLRIALDNLLGNAWKFTRGRAPAHIEFAAEPCAGAPRVYRVRDNGAGFDMAQAGRLFGNFQRLHSQEEFRGTGIGLANVQRVIARHGGRVWAEAAPGEGATFYFTLSASAAPPSENEKRAP